MRSPKTRLSAESLERRDLLAVEPYLFHDLNDAPAPFPYVHNDTVAMVNGQYVFAGGDRETGLEVWRSDGTPEGSGLLRDINPGTAPSVSWKTEFKSSASGDVAYFLADQGAFTRLWKTDGSSVALVHPEATDVLAVTDEGAFFTTESYPLARLWFAPNDGDTSARFLAEFDQLGERSIRTFNDLGVDGYFRVCSSESCELWRSDGTREGTLAIALGDERINEPHPFQVGDQTFIFDLTDRLPGSKIHELNGTSLGERVATVPSHLFAMIRDRLIFVDGPSVLSMSTPDFSPTLLLTDGHPSSYVSDGSSLFMAHRSGDLHITDGTVLGTRRFFQTESDSIAWVGVANGKAVFFDADTNEIGITQGTFESTRTKKVPEELASGRIRFSQHVRYAEGETFYSEPSTGRLLRLDIETLEFLPVTSRWTATLGIAAVPIDDPQDRGFVLVGNQGGSEISVVSTDGSNLETLWTVDGLAVDTIESVTAVGEAFYIFDSRGDLWKAGSGLPVRNLTDSIPALNRTFGLAGVGRDNRFLFVGQLGRYLSVWWTDGTVEGTSRAFTMSADAEARKTPDGRLFFRGDRITWEPFVSGQWYETDGTLAGTVAYDSIDQAPDGTPLENPVVFEVGERRFAISESDGEQVWGRIWPDGEFRTVGSPFIRVISTPIQVSGSIFFQAVGRDGKTYVYRLRGRTSSIEKYSELPIDRLLDVRDGSIFVTRNDGVNGSELWSIPLRVDGSSFSHHDDQNLVRYCRDVSRGERSLDYDVNFDSTVDERDIDAIFGWANIPFGDSNFDGIFDSSDLVAVFQRGNYESGRATTWRYGDWNCDGRFDSADFVKAFKQSRYQRSAVTVAQSDAAFAIRTLDTD